MKQRVHVTSIALLASGLVLMLAGIPDASRATPATTASVDITFENIAPYYQPQLSVVPAGTPIRWLNTTASDHSVRHDACLTEDGCAFQSSAVPPNSSFIIAPLPPGRYTYHCELHPIMRGTLIVTEPPGQERASLTAAQSQNSSDGK